MDVTGAFTDYAPMDECETHASSDRQEEMHAEIDLAYESYLQERIACEASDTDQNRLEVQYFRALAASRLQRQHFRDRENLQAAPMSGSKRSLPSAQGTPKRRSGPPAMVTGGWNGANLSPFQPQQQQPSPFQQPSPYQQQPLSPFQHAGLQSPAHRA